MANENKKYYSKLSIYPNVPNPIPGGNPTVNLIFTDGIVRKLKPNQNPNNGKWFLSGVLYINNRTQRINEILGTNFDVNAEGIRTNLTFSSNAATRMDSLRGNRDWFPCHFLEGFVSVESYTDRSGNPAIGLRIFVIDFKPDFETLNRLENAKNNNGGNNGAPGGYGNNGGNNGGVPNYGGNNGYNAAPAQQAQNNNRNGYQPNGNAPGYRGNSGNQVNYQPPGSVAQTGQFVTMDDDDGELPF